jgi:hypothetical protein
MKVIKSLFGTVALRVSGDSVAPEGGFIFRDFIEFVALTYHFTVKPQLPPQGALLMPAIQQLVFQDGVLIVGEKKLAIMQLVALSNEDIITSATTEAAETILNDYMKRLDEALGYRFASSKTDRRAYLSNLVVQFDIPIDERLEGLRKIEACLAREIPRPAWPFKMKRLAFGYGDVAPVSSVSFDALEKSDFVIERRSGEPYSESRYFCGAPLSTTEHIRVLEMLEQEMAK